MSEAVTADAPRFSHRRLWTGIITGLGLAAILTVYVYLQCCIYPTVYTEQDCDAYLILAKRMAAFQPLAQADPDPFLHQGHMWVENAAGKVTAKFAPGYPLVLAISYWIGGDEGMILASPVMAGLAIIGLFMLTRLWTGPAMGLLAAATLAINFPLNNYAAYFLTHATMTCTVVWGMYFLWRWIGRPTITMGVASGLTLAFAAMVRHTGVLLAIPLAWSVLAAFLAARREQRRFTIAPLIALLGSYALLMLLFMAYNWLLFGGPLTTGYALSDEQTAFSFSRMIDQLPSVYTGLSGNLTTFIFPLALLGMIAVGPWPQAVLRLLWLLPTALLYASYYWLPAHLSGYRFMLNLVPLLIASAYLLIHRAASTRLQRWPAGVIVLAMVIWLSMPSIRQMIDGRVHDDSRPSLQVARFASAALGDNTVVFSQHPFVHYVGTRRHWQLYDLASFNRDWGRRTFTDPQRRGSPRMQPLRLQRLIGLYNSNSPADLQSAQRDIVQRALEQHRQVAFLIPADPGSRRRQESLLGPGWTLAPLGECQPKDGWTWALYTVRPPPPEASPPGSSDAAP